MCGEGVRGIEYSEYCAVCGEGVRGIEYSEYCARVCRRITGEGKKLMLLYTNSAYFSG